MLPRNQEWTEDALCAQTDPAIFFPEKGHAENNRAAKAVCAKCPVRQKCLDYAVDVEAGVINVNTSYPSGIFGGLSAMQRRPLVKARKAQHAAGTTPEPRPLVAVANDDRPATQQRGMSYVGGANGGTHYPLPTAPQHIEGRGNAKPSIDWGTPADPKATTALRCRWCRKPADDLVDDLCTACHIDAELKFTGPVAVPDLDHDDAPSPDTQPEHEHEEHDPMSDYPDYVRQMADVMARSEGHPDPGVKAARKVVANAFVKLNKTLDAAEAPKAKPTRKNNALGLTTRLAALGVAAKDVRAWAVDAGLDVPSRGILPARIVDAWENAHRQGAA